MRSAESATTHFVDCDLLNRIVGVSQYLPRARIGFTVLTRTYEQMTPPAVVQGATLHVTLLLDKSAALPQT